MVWLRLLGLVFGHTVYAIPTASRRSLIGLGSGITAGAVARYPIERMAEREPKNATALFVAGIAVGSLRKPDQALTLIRRAVAIEPDNAQFQVALRHIERTVVKP